MSKEKISKVLKTEFKSGFSTILYKQPVVSSVSSSFKHRAHRETLFSSLSIFFLSTFSTFDVFLFDRFYAYRYSNFINTIDAIGFLTDYLRWHYSLFAKTLPDSIANMFKLNFKRFI